MSAGGARLGIDVGAGRVKAVLARPDGVASQVLFDGLPWLDAGVFVDADGSVWAGADANTRAVRDPARFVPFPLRLLTAEVLEVGGRPVEVADLVAAPLRLVVELAARLAGGVPGQVTVAVPAGWGPQRRTRLRLALYRAGLGQPSLVEAPVAVGWHVEAGGAALPVGTALLVCDFGVGFEATVIRRGVAGFDVLSTVDDAEAAGTAIDEVLARYLTGTDDATASVAWPTVVEARQVKEALSGTSSVLARPAGQPSAVMVNVDVLREVTEPVLVRAVATARRAVEASQVPVESLAWLVCVGGGARMPVVADPLAAEFGVRPVMAAEPDLAAAYGAVQASPPDAVRGRRARTRRNPSVVETRGAVAAVAAPLLVSMALFGQFLAGSQRYGPVHSIVPGMLLAHWGGLAVAAVMAVLATVAGLLVVTAARHEQAPNVPLRQRLLGAALGGGAVGGVVVAAVYATIAAGYFDLPVGPFLRWSALIVLPVSATVVLMGAVVVWRPDPPDGSWLVWLRFPLSTVLLVGFGTLLIGFDVSGSPQVLQLAAWWMEHIQVTPPNQVISLIGRIGAAAVGVGVALLLVRRPLHRVVLSVPLAAVVATTLTANATGMIAAGVTVAVACWWLWSALYVLLRPIFFADTEPPASKPPSEERAPSGSAPIDGVVVGEPRAAEPL